MCIRDRHDGIHEGIISETDWELAHQKREKTGVKYEKTHSLDPVSYTHLDVYKRQLFV